MSEYPGFNVDFTDLLQLFVDESVEFLVVGAHAMAAHGLPRATGDLDLFVRPTADNAPRVLKALVRYGVPIAAHGVTADDFETRGTVYQIGLPPRRIDILTQLSAVKSALGAVEREILKDHSRHCVAHAIDSGDASDQREKLNELIELLSKHYRL